MSLDIDDESAECRRCKAAEDFDDFACRYCGHRGDWKNGGRRNGRIPAGRALIVAALIVALVLCAIVFRWSQRHGRHSSRRSAVAAELVFGSATAFISDRHRVVTARC